ncbi:MAG: DUF445 family protein [Clostridia bacterium]|jgi:uncharacterized membrane protein YheB (UPF0754 family)|nr:DUF445 family protein [Clostridia bacterium]
MNPGLWLVPIIGALIGWFTNYLAVKMIFRPQKPVVIPVLGLAIQGVLPKRKAEIARSLGEVVARELVDFDDVAAQVSDRLEKEDLINLLAGQANEAVVRSLPHIVPEPVKMIAGSLVGKIVQHQGYDLLMQFTGQAMEEMKKSVDIALLVEDKINQMDWEQLERLVLEVASRELKHIEILGGVLGFLIGLAQMAVAYLFN